MSVETQTSQVQVPSQFNNHLNSLIAQFYEFMGDCYIEYNLKKVDIRQSFIDYFMYKLYYNYGVKRRYLFTNIDSSDNGDNDDNDSLNDNLNNAMDTVSDQLAGVNVSPVVNSSEITDAISTPDTQEGSAVQSVITSAPLTSLPTPPTLTPPPTSPYVVLYYVKTLKGYKTNAAITQLCRHLILDTTNMKILSLGIPKAVKLDDFLQRNSITPTDITTSLILDDQGARDKLKYRVYKFPEGTMLTYNPSMQKLNTATITSKNDADNDEHDIADAGDHQVTAEDNIKREFADFLKYATRKKVGTSSFAGAKTFATMFEENNAIANANLDNIPSELIDDTVLVFNIEHIENRMISTTVRNFNTLCAVYRFKASSQANIEWSAISNIVFSEANSEANSDANSDANIEANIKVKDAFTLLAKDMVTPIHVANFKKQVAQFGVNLNLPEVISSFERQSGDGNGSGNGSGNGKVVVPIDQVNIEQLINIVDTKDKHFQGFILYGINGERTKIMNPKYKALKELKGNKPITLEPWNMKNLFFIYWKQMTDKNIETFLSEFQNDSYCQGPNNYINLFKWIAGCVQYFARALFNTYQAAFVKRTLNKMAIPYSMKPLCGDLHKAYLATGLPTSISMVEQFMFTLPAGKVFWRIFGTPQTLPPMTQAQS